MPQLSADQIQALREAAEAEGVDPEDLIAAAQEYDGSAPAEPLEPIKLFQYHLPFLKVREVREYLRLTEAVPDQEMLCGEWLGRHGGVLVAQPGKAAPDEE